MRQYSVFVPIVICLFILGCEKSEHEPATAAPKEVALQSDAEKYAKVLEIIKENFGTVQSDENGKIIGVDLADKRTSVGDAAFESVVSITGLKKLSVSGAGLSAKSLALLGDLRDLEELFLQDTATTDDDLLHLSENLTQLKRLRFRRLAYVSDEGIEYLLKLKQLRVLALIDMPAIHGKSIEIIAKNRTITSLDLRNCSLLQVRDYQILSEMKQLTELKVSGVSIDDSVVDVIRKFPRLTSLTIEDAMVSRECMAGLFADPDFAARMKSLYFARMAGIVNDKLLIELKDFPQLKTLSIKQIPVSGTFLTEWLKAEKHPPLEELILDRVMLKPEARDAISKFETLKRIDISE